MGVIFKSTSEILCVSRVEKENLSKSLYCDTQENEALVQFTKLRTKSSF